MEEIYSVALFFRDVVGNITKERLHHVHVKARSHDEAVGCALRQAARDGVEYCEWPLIYHHVLICLPSVEDTPND